MGSRACVRAVIPRTRGRVINQAVRRFGRLVRCPDCWPRFPAMLRDFVVTPLGAKSASPVRKRRLFSAITPRLRSSVSVVSQARCGVTTESGQLEQRVVRAHRFA
jgi:hypothetical protein